MAIGIGSVLQRAAAAWVALVRVFPRVSAATVRFRPFPTTGCLRVSFMVLAAASTAAMDFRPARAETARLRVSYGYSIGYLPLMVMRDQSLLEKHAAALGLGTLQVDWQVLDGGNNINDAMLAGALDIAGIGIPATDGIVGEDGEQSLANLGRLAQHGMAGVDAEILGIMQDKLRQV